MKRHGFDVISGGFGGLFIWVGLVELIPRFSVPASTLWPIVAIAAGISLLVSAIRRDQREEVAIDPDPADES